MLCCENVSDVVPTIKAVFIIFTVLTVAIPVITLFLMRRLG